MAARLEIDPGDYSYSLWLDMAEQASGGARAVSIQFDGVADLNLQGVGGGLSQIMGSEVETIRERQLERLNFRVTDFEHGTIKFPAATTTWCANTPPNQRLKTDVENARLRGSLVRHD
jgi:hypothetical protein